MRPKTPGPRESGDLPTVTQQVRDQAQHEHPGSGRATSLPPRGRGPDSPGPGAGGAPALSWRCRRPTPATRLSSPLPVSPGAAFPIAQVTPELSSSLPQGAGRAGEAAARWGRRQVRPLPQTGPPRRFASFRSVATPAGCPRRDTTSARRAGFN